MKLVKNLIPTLAIGMAATVAMAAERPFVGGYIGESSSNYGHSSGIRANMPGVNFDRVIDDSFGWGVRGGIDQDRARYYLSYDHVSDSHSRHGSFREQKFIASYDFKFPVMTNTNLFAGASVGVDRLKQKTSGFRKDSEWGYLGGVQAGVLQELSPDVGLELGFRYAKHTSADINFRRSSDGVKVGEADLNSNQQLYLGLNWKF